MGTVGIRGTDHETILIATSLEDGKVAAGTYNKVYSGATILQSANGELLLDSNQVGFVSSVPGSVNAPLLIEKLPRAVEDLLASNNLDRINTSQVRLGPGNGVSVDSAISVVNAVEN